MIHLKAVLTDWLTFLVLLAAEAARVTPTRPYNDAQLLSNESLQQNIRWEELNVIYIYAVSNTHKCNWIISGSTRMSSGRLGKKWNVL